MKQRLLHCLVLMLGGALGTGTWAQAPQAAPSPAHSVQTSASSAASPASSAESAGDRSARAAVAAHRKAEHDRIRHEREAIKAQRLKDEAECYKRFAVEDCLKPLRAQARDAESRLRAREIELNDAERKEKAADRVKSIEDKQRPVQADAPGRGGPDAVLRSPAADPQATKAQRDHDAQLRAQQQRSKVDRQSQEQAGRAAESAERASQARARHAETLKAAQERRARVEKAQADAAAQGRTPAAPLPAPAASAPAQKK